MKRAIPSHQRPRGTARAQMACVTCKERKLKCDNQIPACANCLRSGVVCLVEDAASKRHLPRNYLETLEKRVAQLEVLLLQQSGGSSSKGGQYHHHPLTTQSEASENDDAQNLAAKVGMLDLNAAGAEPLYLGSSSAFAFSRVISPSLRQVNPWKPAAVFNLTNPSPPSPIPLPDYNTCIALSNAYFQNIHIQYPFLHEPKFREWEAKVFNSSDGPTMASLCLESVPLFFLNMVYSIGALLLPNSRTLAEQLYLSAQLYIDEVLMLDNLESIQAILACTMFSLRSPTGPSIWRLTGLALFQCVEFGYHRSCEKLGLAVNHLQTELRKRVFWCAYGVHCMAAIILGRPLALPPQEADVEYPLDVDDSAITDAEAYGTPRTSRTDERPTSMTHAIHVFRLRRLWACIHTTLYSNSSLLDRTASAVEIRARQLRRELDEWFASPPPASRRLGDGFSIFGKTEWYESNYSYTILLLYRWQLAERSGVDKAMIIECLKAAANICHINRRLYIGTQVNYTWATLKNLFLAGLTYLHCIWEYSSALEAVRYDEVSSTCSDCTIVLAVMAREWDGAAPYRDIFEALSRRTMTMMVEKNEEMWTAGLGGPSSAQASLEDLAQWRSDVINMGIPEDSDRLMADLIRDFTNQDSSEEAIEGP